MKVRKLLSNREDEMELHLNNEDRYFKTSGYITSFKVTVKRDGKWVDLENVGVKDVSGAVIGTGGNITLSQGHERLDLTFDQVYQVSAVKLTVFETDINTNNGVVTELLVPCE